MKYIFLLLLILVSCREMYDEDFEQDLEESNNTDGTTTEDISYRAELVSTDASVSDLSGTVDINIKDNEVSVSLNVTGIPANLIQVHYTYSNAPCNQLSIAIPNDNTTTRTYNVSETQTVSALNNDLKASGASTSDGDINLGTRSFLVKAFQNFSGIPNPSGTNSITILCGDIQVNSSGDEDTGAETTTGDTGSTDTTGVVSTTTSGSTTF